MKKNVKDIRANRDQLITELRTAYDMSACHAVTTSLAS